MLALAALAALACSRPASEALVREVLTRHFEAVQSGDDAALAELLAGCPPDACRARIAAIREDVARQRAAGEYRFEDPWGIGLARAFVLGRGGYWQVERARRVDPERILAEVRVRTQYVAAETRELSRDAVVEYLVEPLGHVRRLRPGDRSPGGLRSELVELELQVELVAGDPERGWRLAGLRPLPETAVFRQVTWRPE